MAKQALGTHKPPHELSSRGVYSSLNKKKDGMGREEWLTIFFPKEYPSASFISVLTEVVEVERIIQLDPESR